MNNDTYTEARRQWVRDQQDMISPTPIGYENLAKDMMGHQIAEEYHQLCFDRDHAEALQKNETWDTLQAIIDDDSTLQAQSIIAKLRRNWIVEALTRE